MLRGWRGLGAIARAAQIAAYAVIAMTVLAFAAQAEPAANGRPAAGGAEAGANGRLVGGGAGLRHDGRRPGSSLPEQSPAQCPALRNPRDRRERSHRARGVSPAGNRHLEPDRPVFEQPHESGDHPGRHRPLHSAKGRDCGVLVRHHHHPDPVQRLPDRQPHAPGRGPGVLGPRGAAHDRTEHPAQRRHRLYESAADRRDPRASAQQRERAGSDAAADPRPLHRRRGHAHRRRAGGVAARRRPLAAVHSPSRTTSPPRRNTCR